MVVGQHCVPQAKCPDPAPGRTAQNEQRQVPRHDLDTVALPSASIGANAIVIPSTIKVSPCWIFGSRT